ncbi:hypothetical protein ACQI4F_24050 [Mycolicibacterium vaccae]|uniref:hypothetical protein n=1 Tax=Mycolicibacterium vaccae TaxID=1810 RepID=UPI003CECAF7B
MKALWPDQAVLAVPFGLLMVLSATAGATGAAWVAAAAAGLAVLLSARMSAAATAAVLLTVVTVLLGAPTPMYTAASGLAAAGYLALRHNGGRVSVPVMVAAVVFTAVTTLAVTVPIAAPWLPLVAPVALFAAYVVALRPFLRD